MPKKKQFYIKGKDEIKDLDAPVISNEFIDHFEGNEYRGQDIEVRSDTKLESDLGTGEAMFIRSYQFTINPEIFNKGIPSSQEIFNSHTKGIAAMLWQDGLQPATEIEPRLVYVKDKQTGQVVGYWIIVTARMALGQTLLETPQTLTEILHGGRRQDTNKV